MAINTINPPLATTKRAFVYLRVSSDGQVQTDYSADGLSIDAQREAGSDKAAQLDASIAGEYKDPGRSAYVDLHKRTSFLQMLDDLKRANATPATRVDYVIVWALNRWARNIQDHFRTRDLVRAAGAELVSITEPMIGQDTPEGFFTEGLFALNNQYESMKTGRNVRGGLKRKASLGGTYGPARLGYLNTVDELPDGRRIAIVVPDPERSHFLTTAFQLYDSGEYSISQLTRELDRLGLRCRPTLKRPERPLSSSVVQRILRSPYYIGQIVYKAGTPDEQTFSGRHEPLIDVETFERVQLLLDQKRVSGERPQKHHHYLKGSVFCGDCGNRLVYSITTGKNGGKYPYFFCSARINGTRCNMRFNIAPDKIEEAIAAHYETIQLTPREVEQAKQAIRDLAQVSEGALHQIRVTKEALIRKLEASQDRLLDLYDSEAISKDVLTRRQGKLERELRAAHESLAETEGNLAIEQAQLNRALELAEDVCGIYLAADEQTRRGYNQAFFKKLLVIGETEDTEGTFQLVARIHGSELTEPYALLLAEGLVDGIQTETQLIRAAELPNPARQNRRLSSPNRNGTGIAGPVSNFERMAEGEGFEPSVRRSRTTVFETAPFNHSGTPPGRSEDEA